MQGGKPPVMSRKIMVVADPTRESVGALQYALSNVVVEYDELILIHVENPSGSWRNTFSIFLWKPSGSNTTTSTDGGTGSVVVDFFEEMKNICHVAHPKLRVNVEVVKMEGRDKASVVIDRSNSLGVDLLIVGQRRSFSTAILGRRSGGSRRGAKTIETSDYLIENSKCTCVGVQKKGQNAGYLLNTKTQKNFWLLA